MDKLKVAELLNTVSEQKQEKFNNNIRSSMVVNTDVNRVDADFEWLEIMEDTIRYLDNILRNPNRFIVN